MVYLCIGSAGELAEAADGFVTVGGHLEGGMLFDEPMSTPLEGGWFLARTRSTCDESSASGRLPPDRE